MSSYHGGQSSELIFQNLINIRNWMDKTVYANQDIRGYGSTDFQYSVYCDRQEPKVRSFDQGSGSAVMYNYAH